MPTPSAVSHPFPALFLSHGSPDLPLHPSPAFSFLQQLGKQLGKPKAILVVSAHWLSKVPQVSTAAQPQTIHDFWGFPAELYQLQYSAPGAPELAKRVVEVLRSAGLDCETDGDRGLDHGAWEPLMLMYPDADIPVTQLSLQPHQGTAYHLRLGQALAPLRQEGVLILTSGAVTHNLRSLGQYTFHAEPPAWAVEFDRWLATTLTHPDIDALLNYRHLAPYASQNHPTEEHFLPLFVAIGAGSVHAKAIQLHSSFTYGAFSMAAYAFGNGKEIAQLVGTKS